MTPIFFIVVFFAGCVMSLTRHPIFGLYTYIFTFYMSPSYNWWGKLIPDLRYLLLAALVAAISFFTRSTERQSESWLTLFPGKVLLILAVYMWLQLAWAVNFGIHLDGAINYTKHVFVFYLTYHLLNSKERIRDFLLLHVLGCFYFGYLALGAGGGRLEDVGGPVGGANELGQHLSTAAIIGGVFWLTYSGRIRIFVTLCIPFIVNGIVLTVSRGALLGFVMAGATTGFFIPRAYRTTFLFLSFCALLLLSMLAHDALRDRVSSTIESLTTDETQLDASANKRLAIFDAGMQIGQDYPLGSGYRGTRLLTPRYLDPELLTDSGGGRSAHNTFAAVFAEHGYLCALLYVLLIGWTIKTLFSTRRPDPAASDADTGITVAIGSALVGMYVSGNFSNNFFTETQYWLLAVLCAHLAVQKKANATSAAPVATHHQKRKGRAATNPMVEAVRGQR